MDGRIVTVPRVRGVWISGRPSNRTAYGAGEAIKARVEFNLPIEVTGRPQLKFKVGDRMRQARYSVRSVDQCSLFFQYGVQAEDLDADGLSVPRSALTLNGGSIRSIAAAPAALNLGSHAIRHDRKHTVDGRIVTVPQVMGVRVNSRPSNRIAYGVGEAIEVRVDFDLPIEVTGSPQMGVDVGGRTREARYSVRSVDQCSLFFQYLIGAEDLDADGFSVPRSALTLNGGSIRSVAAAPAALDLGKHTIRHDRKHAVDGGIVTVPRVRGVQVSSRPSHRTAYGAGERIKVRVDFNLPIEVTGTPQLKLKLGARTRQARYSGRSVDQCSLFFQYRVQTEDSAPGGIAIAADGLSLDGGSIHSIGGTPAVLDLDNYAFKPYSKHKVNGSVATPPEVRGVKVASLPSNGTIYGAGERIRVRVEFDLPIEVTGSPQLGVEVGDRTRQAWYSGRSVDQCSLFFQYRVQAEDAAPGGIAITPDALTLSDGRIESIVGAAATLDLGQHVAVEDPSHSVDGGIPTTPVVSDVRMYSVPSNGAAYGAGEGIRVRVEFDQPLEVTGSPQLELEVGDRMRQARYYVSSVSKRSLFFQYRVQAEDAAPGGIAITPDALTLSDGRIESIVGAAATLDLGQHVAVEDPSHSVDGGIPTTPVVSDVRMYSVPSNGAAYGAGEGIRVRVEFDQPLEVTGSPQLELEVGDRMRQARYYVSSVSKRSLFFQYRVQAEDAAPEGIAIAPDALTLNGGSIRSKAAAPAVLDLGKHAIRHVLKHSVDGRIVTVPRVREVQVSSRPSNRTAYGAGERIKVRVDFNLPIEVSGKPQLDLKVGDRMRQACYSVRSVNRRCLFFQYRVQAEDAAPGGIAIAPDALTLNGGSIRSKAAAPAVLDLGTQAIEHDSQHKVDGSTYGR